MMMSIAQPTVVLPSSANLNKHNKNNNNNKLQLRAKPVGSPSKGSSTSSGSVRHARVDATTTTTTTTRARAVAFGTAVATAYLGQLARTRIFRRRKGRCSLLARRAAAAQPPPPPTRIAKTTTANVDKPLSREFKVVGDDFVLDGRPHRIISGSVSYFRVLPEQWRDRLEKLKGLGCNSAEVYVPWNLHEPRQGEFQFDGRCDISAFLGLCQDLEIDVLLRPGPYICAEWEFGGLPWWLLRRQDPVPLRSSDEEFLKCVQAWWLGQLLPRIRPFLAANGGPILAIQLENEFGYWGSDQAYLERLRDMLRGELSSECPLLFTSDGTFWPDLQANGGLEGVLRTANFGSDPGKRLAELREAQPEGPLCNMEFWVGWFDAWGAVTGRSYRAADDVAQTLRETLAAGASVNLFVFHGGTSFGFCGAGANISTVGRYEPQVTSYDYGGLLDEAGEVTEKYLRCREVIAEFLGKPDVLQRDFPRQKRLPCSPPLELEASLSLEAALPALISGSTGSTCVRSALPLSAEQLGIGYGYVLYRTATPPSVKPGGGLPIKIGADAVRDFASIMLDGNVVGTVYRNDNGGEFALPDKGGSLDILVEMMGRTNFGPAMLSERKGLVGPGSVQLGSLFTGPLRALIGWDNIPLPMDEGDLARLPWGSGQSGDARLGRWQRGPRFFRYALFVQQPADGFLELEGFRKGFACVNGFNLGRYWEVGPQRSLFIPGPLLRRGRNEVVVFDIDSPGGTAEAVPAPRIVSEALWTSGLLPQGAKEATSAAAASLAQVLRNFVSGGS
ncbi:unnamed protein product [Polarella glacialis]|uniref:Beta-galactosidase n=1 Tax=Polarella glacialis TaxID=89957 RepID=A0A813J965_POLGL|nr:unnamed protein product [Polarella glacialis]